MLPDTLAILFCKLCMILQCHFFKIFQIYLQFFIKLILLNANTIDIIFELLVHHLNFVINTFSGCLKQLLSGFLTQFLIKFTLVNIESCDEIILYDCESEGSPNGFHKDVVNTLKINPKNCVFSGGVSDLVNSFRNNDKTPKALTIENSILYREFSKSNYYEKL